MRGPSSCPGRPLREVAPVAQRTSRHDGWPNGTDGSWRRIRAAGLLRDGGTCRLNRTGCTIEATQVHHVYGRAVTGDDPAHCVAACWPCNRAAGTPSKDEPRSIPRTAW